MRRFVPIVARTPLGVASVVMVLLVAQARAQQVPKLWIDSAAVDTFSCGGLLYQLTDYDRDDLWLGHVFALRVSNQSDSMLRFDATGFAALLRDGTDVPRRRRAGRARDQWMEGEEGPQDVGAAGPKAPGNQVPPGSDR